MAIFVDQNPNNLSNISLEKFINEMLLQTLELLFVFQLDQRQLREEPSKKLVTQPEQEKYNL